MTPVGPMDPKNWPKEAEMMGSGNQTGRSIKFYLLLALGWTTERARMKGKPEEERSPVGTGYTDQRSIKFGSAPGS
ncbi:hypothetical protein ROHU_000044 [Labeo rohita]|uniref:Uncharacterized protein n=1 Tax=Labeo rohita TaxID=84645 RepID=A0A498P7D3_LABRO|nr:hypothetical protein ROHU_000044 [Labeo rohita]